MANNNNNKLSWKSVAELLESYPVVRTDDNRVFQSVCVDQEAQTLNISTVYRVWPYIFRLQEMNMPTVDTGSKDLVLTIKKRDRGCCAQLFGDDEVVRLTLMAPATNPFYNPKAKQQNA